MKKIIIASSIIVLVAIAGIAIWGNTGNDMKSEIFAPNGKAIKGYDPVAFFTEKAPVIGSEKFTYQWKGATWYFSDENHLDQFKKDPETYAPQYGGYCAYGTSQGHKAPTETDTWTVKDGKLYFNYNQDVKQTWDKDQEGFIKLADQHWPKIKNEN